MALTYASPTNLLEHLTLQESTLYLMRQALITNNSTLLVSLYTDLIAALTTDKATAQAVANNNVDKLIA